MFRARWQTCRAVQNIVNDDMRNTDGMKEKVTWREIHVAKQHVQILHVVWNASTVFIDDF